MRSSASSGAVAYARRSPRRRAYRRRLASTRLISLAFSALPELRLSSIPLSPWTGAERLFASSREGAAGRAAPPPAASMTRAGKLCVIARARPDLAGALPRTPSASRRTRPGRPAPASPGVRLGSRGQGSGDESSSRPIGERVDPSHRARQLHAVGARVAPHGAAPRAHVVSPCVAARRVIDRVLGPGPEARSVARRPGRVPGRGTTPSRAFDPALDIDG